MIRECCALILLSAALAAAGDGGLEKTPDLIRWRSDSAIFPEHWTRAPFHARAAPVEEAQKERARRQIRKALAKYPPELVERTLRQVFVLGRMSFYDGVEYSGTASQHTLYLVIRDPAEGFSEEFIESNFHHEYSTLLLNRHLDNFDQDAWQSANPEGFRYLGGNSWSAAQGKDGGALAIEQGRISLERAGRDTLRQGFLSEYSMSSIENDFNLYAAALFVDGPELARLAERYPAIARKREIAIRFYSALHPALDKHYFNPETAVEPK